MEAQFVTPVVERNVTVTMTEGEAALLRAFFRNDTTSRFEAFLKDPWAYVDPSRVRAAAISLREALTGAGVR